MRRKSSHRSIWRLSAKLAYLPSLYLSPQGTISSFDGGKAAKTYSVPVTASWEIDIFGKLRNAKRQSQALYAQSQDYRQAVRTQVIAGIANTYYTLLMLDAQLEISEQTKISWKESADATRALMNAGRADNSAVSQMEAAYYSVCASVLDLKEQINQVENSMSLLLASTPHTIERGKLDTLNIPTSFSTGIPVQLLSNRPDVRAAKRSLEQAFYAANQARSAFYPSITLSGSAGGGKFGREYDCQSRKVPRLGGRFAPTTALCTRATYRTVENSQPRPSRKKLSSVSSRHSCKPEPR